jgi:teichuronic acid biosynthesis glycosyltransferase TuaC
MTLRVLIVARWYPAHDNPGRGSFVADLVEALSSEGCDVRVASWEHAFYPRLSSSQRLSKASELWAKAVSRADALNTPGSWGAGVPVARLPARHTTPETLGEQIDGHAATLVPFGAALHARWPFDVIHAHTALPDGVAAVRLGRAIHVPVVVTEHDRTLRERLPASAEARTAYRRMLEDAALTVAVSAQYRDILCAALDVPTTSIDVLPNALPAGFFSTPLDAPRDPDELLYVGGRNENKGMTTLLEAFAVARAAHPTLRLRLIGRSENEEEQRWERLAEDLGIRASVQFDPPGDRLAVATAMSRAGIFVHPSPFESFGMVAAEALAAGLPIAATPSGVEEIVGTDGSVGEIATGLDAPSLFEAIERVLERRSQFVPERQRQAAARFKASNVARETIARYRAVIDAKPGKAGVGLVHDLVSAAPVSPAPFRAPFVIGLNRQLAQLRSSDLPGDLGERVVLATRPRKTPEESEMPVGRVIDIDGEGVYRARLAALGAPPGVRWSLAQRAWQFLRSPGAALTRRRLRRNPNRFIVEVAQRLILEAWERVPAEDGRARQLLALDVDDVLAAQLAIARDGQLAPGGARWLADRWDESQVQASSQRGDGVTRSA